MNEEKKPGDDYLFEITSFLIMSAKRCLGPEYMYGSARLIQTLNLLSFLPEYVSELKGNEFLMKARLFIEGDELWWELDKQRKFIEEMSVELSKQIKKKLE